MAGAILPPLPDDSFVFTPVGPEFLDLTILVLGDVGTNLDGFDPVFSAVAHDHGSLPGLLQRIMDCFRRAASPFADIGVRSESLVDDAQAEAATSFKVVGDRYDSLFLAASPAPPVSKSSAPPTLGGPSGGPPVGAKGPPPCPPGSERDAGAPGHCVPIQRGGTFEPRLR